MRRFLVLVACAAMVALGVAVPAGAQWTGGATGGGSARATVLGPPSSLTATCVSPLLDDRVKVAWTPPSGGPAIATYQVEITAPGAAPVHQAVPGLSITLRPAAAVALLGTYEFRVRPLLDGWLGPWSSGAKVNITRVLFVVVCANV